MSSSARYLRSPSRPMVRSPRASALQGRVSSRIRTVGGAPRPRSSAIPARALRSQRTTNRSLHLLGRSRLFASEDGGRTYTAVCPDRPEVSEITALRLRSRPGRHSGGRDRRSGDGQPRRGAFRGATPGSAMLTAPVDTIATDAGGYVATHMGCVGQRVMRVQRRSRRRGCSMLSGTLAPLA